MRIVTFVALAFCCMKSCTGSFDEHDKKQRYKYIRGNKNHGNGNGNGNGNGLLSDEVRLLVKYKDEQGRSDVARLGRDGKIDIDLRRSRIASIRTHFGNITALRNDPHVERFEIDEEVYAVGRLGPEFEVSNKTETRRLSEQTPYGITMVQADELWDIPGASPIKVCVVDTGYGLGHPDLPGQSHGVAGWNDPSEEWGVWNVDGDGHGTHCAGTIGAIGNNGAGVVGVNPDPSKFSFFIGKGIGDNGSGHTSTMLNAAQKCAENGAKVISLSIGSPQTQSAEEVFKDLYDEGILIVAAAGNDGNSDYNYPASYPEVISVASVDINMNKAASSQWNDQVEIAGPGVNVYSTVTANSGSSFSYSSKSGTSMATPHVAGVAALVWSHFPTCTNNQIRNVLIKTALDRGTGGCDDKYGFGIVQAKDAFDLLTASGCSAGGIVTSPLSAASFGGCNQDSEVTAPPTLTPIVCDFGQVKFQLELLTDSFGGETSWDVTGANSNVVAQGSGYESGKAYIVVECLASGNYTFSIYDSYGDGMCCAHGTGSYTVHWDGVEVASGGDFGVSATAVLSQPIPSPGESAQSHTPSMHTSAAPSLQPSMHQTNVPVTLPNSLAPTPSDYCAHVVFQLDLLTDNYAQETSWDVKDANSNVVASGTDYGNGAQYVETSCLPAALYTFTIYDSFGDGVCCAYGEGSYTLIWDGEVVGSGGAFGSSDSVQFGSTTSAPTKGISSNPTVGPSTLPSASPSVVPSSTAFGLPSANSSNSNGPSSVPSDRPSTSGNPSPIPSELPSMSDTPSSIPSSLPSFSESPSSNPSNVPSDSSSYPTSFPSNNPSPLPTKTPSIQPSSSPSLQPSVHQTNVPVALPSSLAPTSSDYCAHVVFQLDLLTDNYAQETSWDVKDANSNVVASGTDYGNGAQYVETSCLPAALYTFTIYDSFGDGVCCAHGEGSYTLKWDGEVVGSGGAFGSSDSVQFGSITSAPTKGISSSPSVGLSTLPSASPSWSPGLPSSSGVPSSMPSDTPSISNAPSSTPSDVSSEPSFVPSHSLVPSSSSACASVTDPCVVLMEEQCPPGVDLQCFQFPVSPVSFNDNTKLKFRVTQWWNQAAENDVCPDTNDDYLWLTYYNREGDMECKKKDKGCGEKQDYDKALCSEVVANSGIFAAEVEIMVFLHPNQDLSSFNSDTTCPGVKNNAFDTPGYEYYHDFCYFRYLIDCTCDPNGANQILPLL